jgi:3-isopropylmalate dehydrogenase
MHFLPGHQVRPSSSGKILVGLLPGEGIGPEIPKCCMEVLEAVTRVTGIPLQIQKGGIIRRESEYSYGKTFPEDIVRFCEGVFAGGGAILNGPGGGRYVYELGNRFDLFFKVSPL